MLKKQKRLWIFFGGFFLLYGTLLSLSSTTNLLLSPYGFSNLEISLFAIALIISGLVGSIAGSFYIKRTLKYKLLIRILPLISVILLAFTYLMLNAFPNIALMYIFMILVGFLFTPMIPISYELGCQLCFPIGEAFVLGVLNGGAMLWTFVMNIIVTEGIKLNSKEHSLIVMIIFILMIVLGTVLNWFTKISHLPTI